MSSGKEDFDSRTAKGETVVEGGTGGHSLQSQKNLAEGKYSINFHASWCFWKSFFMHLGCNFIFWHHFLAQGGAREDRLAPISWVTRAMRRWERKVGLPLQEYLVVRQPKRLVVRSTTRSSQIARLLPSSVYIMGVLDWLVWRHGFVQCACCNYKSNTSSTWLGRIWISFPVCKWSSGFIPSRDWSGWMELRPYSLFICASEYLPSPSAIDIACYSTHVMPSFQVNIFILQILEVDMILRPNNFRTRHVCCHDVVNVYIHFLSALP